MKCSYCGAEYEGNFCPECGSSAESQSPVTPSPTHQPSDNQQPPVPNVAAYQKPPKKKKPIYKKWWFYVIIAVAMVAIITAISGRKGKGEKIEWSKIELSEQLPEPPSSKGTLYENSDEKLRVSLDGVTDDQYNDYLDACVDKGFTVDSEKSSNSYTAYNTDGFSLDMNHISDRLSITLKAPMELGSITWPSSTVGAMLPTPKSTTGKFSYEHDDSFFVYIGETSKEDYDQYVADCSANGFHIDYDKGDTYYQADNADGYHIFLEYIGNNIMAVEISAPESGDTSTSEPTTAEPSAAAPSESKPAETQEPSPVVSSEPAPDDTDLVDGMRKDFKDAMDSYEAFYDSYIEFLKSYDAGNLTMLAEYTDFISKAADMDQKFSEWESEDLNDAELAYFIDVQARVNKKLLELE